MGNKRILSDEQIEEMIVLREKGWGIDRIAEHFKAAGTPISAGAINWQCLKHGADTVPRLRGKHTQPAGPYQRGKHIVRPFTADDDALLRVLDMQDFTIAAIARRMGRRPNSIRGRLLTLARMDARAEEAADA